MLLLIWERINKEACKIHIYDNGICRQMHGRGTTASVRQVMIYVSDERLPQKTKTTGKRRADASKFIVDTDALTIRGPVGPVDSPHTCTRHFESPF